MFAEMSHPDGMRAFSNPRLVGRRFAAVSVVAATGSTNADLLAAARAGEPEQVLVADHQTSGRGRLDHRWEAEPGSSLLVSVLVRPDGDAGPVGTAFGLAALDAVRAAGATTVGSKWPNDLVLPDGRKLGGVLLEAVATGTGVAAVVAGLGVNIRWQGPLPDGAADLASLVCPPPGRDDLLVELLLSFERRLDQTPGQLLADYRAACLTLGRWVRARAVDGQIEGRAVDLAPDGALVLEVDGERRTVTAGDVEHVRPSG